MRERTLTLPDGLNGGDVVEVLDSWLDASHPSSIMASSAFKKVGQGVLVGWLTVGWTRRTPRASWPHPHSKRWVRVVGGLVDSWLDASHFSNIIASPAFKKVGQGV